LPTTEIFLLTIFFILFKNNDFLQNCHINNFEAIEVFEGFNY
jgi:hypothetical protein